MTRKQILAMVRKLIADEQATGFTEGGNLEEPEGTQELENYLNRAVDEYSKRQATNRDIRLMKECTVHDGENLPEDFLAFCGAMPLKVIGKRIKFYVPSSGMDMRYLGRLPYVTDYGENETLPYEEDQSIAISALAAIHALNKHEADVSTDLMLLGYGVASNVDNQQ